MDQTQINELQWMLQYIKNGIPSLRYQASDCNAAFTLKSQHDLKLFLSFLGSIGAYFTFDFEVDHPLVFESNNALVVLDNFDKNWRQHPRNYYYGQGKAMSQDQIAELQALLEYAKSLSPSLTYEIIEGDKFDLRLQSETDFLYCISFLGQIGAYFAFDFDIDHDDYYLVPESEHQTDYARIIVIDYDPNWREHAPDFQ